MKPNIHVFLLLLGCSAQQSNAAVAEAPTDGESTAADTRSPEGEEVSVSAEMGALNPQQTHSSFYNAMEGIQQCVTEGTQRLPFLSGEVELSVLVNTSGRPLRVWSEHSSLGDRATEQCMFEALKAVSWPPSLGGPISIASNRFEFPIARGVNPPRVWDSGRASATLQPLAEELDACLSAQHSAPTLTLYVGADGQVLAAGAAHPREVSDSSVDCLLSILQSVQFPPADPAPAKLRFRLQ